MADNAPVVRNRVREKLARDEVVASMTARLVRGIEVAQIAATPGFDSLYVDLEHGPLTIDGTGQIMLAALAVGVTPFVRVPALTPEYVGRVPDAGALGIIAPHVHSAEQARAVVRMAHFPPLGTRSTAGHLPYFGFRTWPAKVGDPVLDAATMVIPMIETLEALEKVDEIVAVDGVAMVLVGTNDLTAEMGIPGEMETPGSMIGLGRTGSVVLGQSERSAPVLCRTARRGGFSGSCARHDRACSPRPSNSAASAATRRAKPGKMASQGAAVR